MKLVVLNLFIISVLFFFLGFFGVKLLVVLVAGVQHLEEVTKDTSGRHIGTRTCALNDQGVGVPLRRQGDDIVASLQVGKRVADRITRNIKRHRLEPKQTTKEPKNKQRDPK